MGRGFQLDPAALRALMRSGDARDTFEEVGRRVADKARELAPKRTGAGASHIAHQVGVDDDGVFVDVGYEPEGYYMAFQELGTEHNPAQPHLRPAIGEDLQL